MHKRIMALIMTASLFASALPVFAEETEETGYMFWDFSKEASEYNGLNIKANSGIAEVHNGILEVGYESGTAPKSDINLSKEYKAIDDVAVIEFDYMTETENVNIYFQNSPLSGSMFRMNQKGNKLTATFASSPTATSNMNATLKDDLEKGRWYHFQYVMDYKNKKMSFWLDGEEIFKEVNFFYQTTEYAPAFSYLLLGITTPGRIYIDNVAAYTPGDEKAIADIRIGSLNIPDIAEENLKMQKTLPGGVTVQWTSSDESVIALDGTVNFPTLAQGDKTVTLTAELLVGEESRRKEFTVTVPSKMSDEEAIAIAKEKLSLPSDTVYDNFLLPAIGENDVSVSWSMEENEILSISQTPVDGSYQVTVTRPETDTAVTLTATFSRADKTDTKDYSLTIKRVLTDAECVDEDKVAILLPKSVTEDFKLPQEGVNGTAISWSCTDNEWIEIEDTTAKVLKRDTEDKEVTLTATVTKGEASDTVEIIVLVLKDIEGNTLLLEEATEALTLGDTSKVKEDLTLPTTGLNDTVITWKTSDSSVVTAEGEVKRSTKTKSANLTATVTKGTLTKEKVFKITVTGKGSSGTGGGGGGSSFSGGGFSGGTSSGTTITLPTVQTPELQTEPVPEIKFADVSDSHWAYKYISGLTERNIVSGMGDGMFMPNGSITREAFVTMLVKALCPNDITEAKSSFADVSDDAWFAKYVSYAYEKGYVMGVDENNFGTGSLITREQMAVIIARCLNLTANKEPDCADKDEISGYAKEAVAALGEKGIMNGDENGFFNPKNNATRAETAKVIYDLLGKDK